MAFPTRVTTLSAAGTSTPIILNPVARTTTVQFSVTSGSTYDATIQVTLDDPTSLSTTSVTWTGLSTTHYSTANINDGVTLYVTQPIGGLRISSTTNAGSAVFVLKALQSVTA